METRRLEYFAVLIAERNFSRAASRLNITQSALSQQIQRLESDVGAQLIDRSIVPFELTAAGQLLLDHTRPLLENMKRIDALATDVKSGKVGRLRIGFVPSLLYSQLPSTVRAFRKRTPGTEIHLHMAPTDELAPMLRNEQIDVAFLYTRPPSSSGLNYTELYREPYVVVLPDDHPLAHRPDVSLAQLSQETILLSPRRHAAEAHDAILGACIASGFSAHDITIENSSYSDQIGFVAAGMGISLLPQRLSDHLQVPGIAYLPLAAPKLESRVLLVINPNMDDRIRNRFIQHCRREYGS